MANPTKSVRVREFLSSGCWAIAASAWAIASPIPKPGPIAPIPIAKPAPIIEAIATKLTLSITTPPLKKWVRL
jgi:hypothetical protein